jgi:aminoglycoside phosphotransferase (APT) family kinase protein
MPEFTQDQAREVREALPETALGAYLQAQLPELGSLKAVKQFPGGYSNLTYLLQTEQGSYVLRRPPHGAAIKSAHDMAREYRVLSHLQGHYDRIPQPVHLCENPAIIGSPFYLMERVKGLIWRASQPPRPQPAPALMRRLSEATIDNLRALHQLDLKATGLAELGRPEGYTLRQVTGWIKRYYQAETEPIEAMDRVAAWMPDALPPEPAPAFLHNDYKYDNLVLNPADPGEILAVLDWEMATVGNPLMDLGTTLAYWAEASDPPALQQFNLTHLPGNLTRQEVMARYESQGEGPLPDMLFYYVFACFKLGVIAQQIYARFKQGHSQDARFALLIHVVKACGQNALRALDQDRI